MLQRLFHRSFLALGLTAACVPVATQAQVREIVSKQVSVGGSDATLALELSDGGELEISLRDGAVVIDGEPAGAFEPGGELDTAWRELLGRAVALEDGPLSAALTDWTAPTDLAGNAAQVAQSIDRTLEASLADVDVAVDASNGTVSVSIGSGRSFLTSLIGSSNRIAVLPEALDGLGPDVSVHVGEDVEVGEGEVVEGSLVVIDGDVLIRGDVGGDLVVIGGTLDMPEGSEVTGAVRLADARFLRNEGSVGNGVVEIDRPANVDVDVEVDTQRIRDQVREELRRELRDVRRDRGEERSFLSRPFRAVASAVGGLLENAMVILILGLLGAAAVTFAGRNVDVIAETARRSPGRSAMVGLAGTVLLLPAWLLGAVALAISIIGIPVAIAWLPLFPLAAVLAAVLGYLAVARNAGEWLADSEYPWTGWIRKSNPLITIVGGLVGLMALYVIENVLSIVPFLGFVRGLIAFAAGVVTFVALQIGFGAVLLSRGGRRREYWPGSYDEDEAWDAAMRVDVEDEVVRDTPDEPADVDEEETDDA